MQRIEYPVGWASRPPRALERQEHMAQLRSHIPFFLCVFCVSVVSLSGGCASRETGSREFAIAPGGYAAAFDSAREVLRRMDFELERVDAAAGVITTLPHYSTGAFEPWDSTQSSLKDEWEDAVNMQARAVRVTFAPAEGAADGAPADETEMVGSVWVTLYRNQRSGRRLDSEWVGGSTFAGDPLQQQRHTSNYLVPIRRDEPLEARLAARILRETNKRAPDADAEVAEASD